MDALQRRVILEDMVQYKLFLVQSNSQQTDEHLPQLVDEILAKVAPFLIQYIWQHQPFNLKYHPEKGIVFRDELILKMGTFCFFLVHVVVFIDRRCPCSHWRSDSVWGQCGGRVVYCLPPAADHRGIPRTRCQVKQNLF